jgi:hypothetical protein
MRSGRQQLIPDEILCLIDLQMPDNFTLVSVPKTFVFEPAKAYSERLTKSIDGLWKLKEVFELGGTAQRPYPWECRRQLSSTRTDPPLQFC